MQVAASQWCQLGYVAHRLGGARLGMLLDVTTLQVVEDVFSFGYHIGIRFRKSVNGSCNGQFSQMNFDDVDIGVDITDTQQWAVVFSSLNIANAGDGRYKIGIRGNSGGNAMISVRGGSFWGALKQGVVWDNSGRVVVTDSIFSAWNKTLPAVQLTSGRASFQNNFFQDAIGTAIQVDETVDRVMVVGNELAGNKIVNGGKDTLVANNHA